MHTKPPRALEIVKPSPARQSQLAAPPQPLHPVSQCQVLAGSRLLTSHTSHCPLLLLFFHPDNTCSTPPRAFALSSPSACNTFLLPLSQLPFVLQASADTETASWKPSLISPRQAQGPSASHLPRPGTSVLPPSTLLRGYHRSRLSQRGLPRPLPPRHTERCRYPITPCYFPQLSSQLTASVCSVCPVLREQGPCVFHHCGILHVWHTVRVQGVQ